ncbi:fumarylacetoacetate hydrolase family protein [Bordetella sp. BOR01]|uniref:fumarylacetoacetate hydrolase family protein n=1 Tax=Bordetella sp. BOR01 TaxID=2854779 RepID=UPI001C474A9E|nr:fumarylacetoacetate hydrolase family protein [Bordetella sp. BOR01]MBV7486849.1 fumarylacetoacetate hydrolase family protein [Bordetella sp. BOR01]
MKLASYARDGRARIGFIVGEYLLDVHDVLSRTNTNGNSPVATDADIHAWIEGGDAAWKVLRAAADSVADLDVPRHALRDMTLLPAVQRPSKICCLALNNSANADRIMSGPKHPAIFTKPSSALVGHGGAIRLKPHYGRVHPEPELALIIGQGGADIPAERAYEHVFGYTAHNDLTSPTMRGEDTFHYRAIHPAEGAAEGVRYVDSHVSYPGRYKGADTFSALGPWIVTRDEIPDPHALDIECHVGEERYASDNTANLFHKTPEVIAFVSSFMTLFPGDVISLGTALAAGGKPGRAVQNADLNQMQGPVSVTIERIGKLSNPIQHSGR